MGEEEDDFNEKSFISGLVYVRRWMEGKVMRGKEF